MHRSRSGLLLSFLFVLASVSPAGAQAWIEYSVTGAVSFENREEDVVMCTVTDEAFLVQTIGEWNVSIESDPQIPGEHAATFMVAAPDSIEALDGFSVGDRFKGDGSVVKEDGGKGQYGFPRVTVTYEAASLTSGTGQTIGIKGRFVCDVM